MLHIDELGRGNWSALEKYKSLHFLKEVSNNIPTLR
jgi:hypothetical protein